MTFRANLQPFVIYHFLHSPHHSQFSQFLQYKQTIELFKQFEPQTFSMYMYVCAYEIMRLASCRQEFLLVTRRTLNHFDCLCLLYVAESSKEPPVQLHALSQSEGRGANTGSTDTCGNPPDLSEGLLRDFSLVSEFRIVTALDISGCVRQSDRNQRRESFGGILATKSSCITGCLAHRYCIQPEGGVKAWQQRSASLEMNV